VQRWKSNIDVADFFLSMPISKLIPSLQLSKESFQEYSEAAKLINEIHYKAVGHQQYIEQQIINSSNNTI